MAKTVAAAFPLTFCGATQRIFSRLPQQMSKMNVFSGAVYLLATSCVMVNLYVLLNRSDTIHYLRIYHLVCFIKNCLNYPIFRQSAP